MRHLHSRMVEPFGGPASIYPGGFIHKISSTALMALGKKLHCCFLYLRLHIFHSAKELSDSVVAGDAMAWKQTSDVWPLWIMAKGRQLVGIHPFICWLAGIGMQNSGNILNWDLLQFHCNWAHNFIEELCCRYLDDICDDVLAVVVVFCFWSVGICHNNTFLPTLYTLGINIAPSCLP